MTDRAEYLMLTELKRDFGFSAGWITRLGEPDRTKPNPHYRTRGAPMQLWHRERVTAFIEAHRAEYDAWLVRRTRLSERAWERAAPLRQQKAEREARERAAVASLCDWAKTVPIHLRRFPDDLQRSCRINLEHHFEYDCEVTDRRIVNMLRHRHTNYEDLLALTDGKVGADAAHLILRTRVNRQVCDRAGIPCAMGVVADDGWEAAMVAERWGEAVGDLWSYLEACRDVAPRHTQSR